MREIFFAEDYIYLLSDSRAGFRVSPIRLPGVYYYPPLYTLRALARCRFRFQFVPFCLREGLLTGGGTEKKKERKSLFFRFRVAFPADIFFCRSKVIINFLAFLAPDNISSFPIKSRTI